MNLFKGFWLFWVGDEYLKRGAAENPPPTQNIIQTERMNVEPDDVFFEYDECDECDDEFMDY